MKYVKLLLPALTLTLLNTACSMDTVSSKDVQAEAVYQNLSLNYSEDTNSTSMSAQFRVGGWSGTTVELESPAGLRINGRTPSKSAFLGTSYEVRSSGFVRSATFEYQGSDGRLLTNSISMDPVVLRYAPSVASVTNTFEVDVEAVNLQPRESLRVELSQEFRHPDTGVMTFARATGTYDKSRAKAVFSTYELNRLNNGTARLEISRSKSGTLAQATREGGTISASYHLRPVSVTITGKTGTVSVPSVAKN